MPVSRSQIGAKLFSEIVFATCSLRVLDASSNKERITMTDNSQFIHLGAYGRAQCKGAARWSCISGRAPAIIKLAPRRRDSFVFSQWYNGAT
jgi:hypothetical protein